MKTKTRRVLALVGSAFLLVVMTIGATVAYLSDTKTVNNTFSVGHVSILLDEADVYDFGAEDIPEDKEHGWAKEGDAAARVTENDYKLFPGHTYDKDPTVTVQEDSEACYVRALVTVKYNKDIDSDENKAFAASMMKWVVGLDKATWVPGENKVEKDDEYVTRTYELRYKPIVPATTEDTKLPALFTKIVLPDNLTNDQIALLKGLKIDVKAEAIQADGFANADAAWAAFEGKTSDSNT